MKVLIIEDEISLLRSIVEYFRKEAYVCEGAGSYADGIAKIEDFYYDCIILDINLPGGSGLELLRYLRTNNKQDGVIIISARDSLDDKIAGLNLGADDYLVKPFHLPELNARVKALIRRKYGQGANQVTLGNLIIDISSRAVFVGKTPVLLTKNEYDLLFFLLANKNRVVSRKSIAEHLFGQEADNLPSFDFVYSHMKNLKKKIKEKGADDIIETVYGLGYKITE
jgi:DNA-binding response OmpR family regulator